MYRFIVLLLGAKRSNLTVLSNSTFRVGAIYSGVDTQLNATVQPQIFPYPTMFKNISILKRLNGEVVSTISTVRKTRNSPGDEIANVNFLRRHLQPLIRSAPRAPILIPIESSYTTSY